MTPTPLPKLKPYRDFDCEYYWENEEDYGKNKDGWCDYNDQLQPSEIHISYKGFSEYKRIIVERLKEIVKSEHPRQECRKLIAEMEKKE